MAKLTKKRRQAKAAAKLPGRMLAIMAAKGTGRSGKHGWRDSTASQGAASAVRQIMKDGKYVRDGQEN